MSLSNHGKFGWQGIAFALVIAFSLSSFSALACPLLCLPQHCTQSQGSPMRSAPSGPACCPAHSGRKGSAPSNAPEGGCIHQHHGSMLPVFSGTIAAERSSVLALVTTIHIPSLVLAIPSLTSIDSSPPTYSTGRAICQIESLFRI
ncbi:MAG TPA: hypothetical protein VKW70_06320 [Terriglobia bacterium]|nr:hypothetical protein [Terriglobia bacterium]